MKINKTIVKLESSLPTLPEDKKKDVIRQIRVLKVTVRKLSITVNVLRHTVYSIKHGEHPGKPGVVEPLPEPRQYTKIEKKIISVLHTKVTKLIKKSITIRKNIEKLTNELPDVPSDKKPVFIKRLTEYKKIIRRIQKQIIHVKRTIRIIKKQRHTEYIAPIAKPLNPIVKSIYKTLIKKETKIVKRIRKVTIQIKKLEDKLPTLPEDKKPAVIKQITVLKQVVKRITKQYVSIKETIHRIAPAHPVPTIVIPGKPGKPINIKVVRVRKIVKKTIKQIKKINVIINRLKVISKVAPVYTCAKTSDDKDLLNKLKEILKECQTHPADFINPQKCVSEVTEHIAFYSTPNHDCLRAPEDLTVIREQKKVIIEKYTKIVTLVKKVRVHRQNINKLIVKLVTVSRDERTSIITKIQEEKTKIVKVRREILDVQVSVRPVFKKCVVIRRKVVTVVKETEKTKVVEIKKTLVEKKKVVRVLISKIRKIRKTIKVLKVKIVSVTDVTEKTEIKKQIKVLVASITKIVKEIKVHKVEIKKIVNELHVIIHRPDVLKPVVICRKEDNTAKIAEIQKLLDEHNKTCNTIESAYATCSNEVEPCDDQITKQNQDCQTKRAELTKQLEDAQKPSTDCVHPKPIREKVVVLKEKIVTKVTEIRKLTVKIAVIQKKIIDRIVKLPTLPESEKQTVIEEIKKFTKEITILKKKIVVIRKSFTKLTKEVTIIKKKSISIIRKCKIDPKPEPVRPSLIKKRILRLVKRVNILKVKVTKLKEKVVISRPKPFKPTPRPLIPEEKEVVKGFEKKIEKLVVKVKEVKKQIVIFKKKLIVAPAPKKPEIRKTIVDLKKTVVKITKKITHIKVIIKKLTAPAPLIPDDNTKPVDPFKPEIIKPAPRPRPLTVIESKFVKKLTVKITKFKKTIKVLKVEISKIRKQIPSVPGPQKDVLKRKITIIKKKIVKISKKIVHIKRTIQQLTVEPAPVKPGKPLAPEVIKVVSVYKKKVVEFQKKIVVVKKEIKDIKIKLPTAEPTEKKVLYKRLVVLRKILRKVVHKVKVLKVVCHNIEHPTKPHPIPIIKPLPFPLEPEEKKTVEKLIKKVSVLVKKIEVTKVKIVELEKKLPTLPEDKKPVVVIQIDKLKKIVRITKKQIKIIKVNINTIKNPAPVIIIKPAPKDVIDTVGKTCKHYKEVATKIFASWESCTTECTLSDKGTECFQTGGVKDKKCETVCQHNCEHFKDEWKEYTNKSKSCFHFSDVIINPTLPSIPKPAPVNPITIKVISSFEKKVKSFTLKVKEIRVQITKLETSLPTLPVSERPAVVRKIVILRKSVVRIVKKIRKIKVTIVNLSRPRPVDPTPGPIWVKPLPIIVRPVEKEVLKIVDIQKTKITEILKKIEVTRVKIIELKKKYRVAPVDEKKTIIVEIKKLTKIVKKYHKEVVVIRRTIHNIVNPGKPFRPIIVRPIRPIVRPYVPSKTEIVVIKKFVKKVEILKTKIVSIQKQIVILKEKLVTATEDQKTVISKKIVVLQRVIKTIRRKVVHIERTIVQITAPVPIRPIRPVSYTSITKIVKKFESIKIRKLTKVEESIVTPLRKKCVKYNKEVEEIKKKIDEVVKQLKEKETEELKEQLKDLTKELRKVAKKTHTCYTLVFQIVKPIGGVKIPTRDIENLRITKVKISKLVKKVTVVRETIKKLTVKLETATEEQKVVINKKIETLKKVEIKITKTIKKFRRVIRVISNPRPVWPIDRLPKPLTPEEVKIVKIFNLTIKKNITKITVIKKKLVVLVKQYETAPADEKPAIKEKIVVLKKTIVSITREINIIRRNVISIKFPTPCLPRPRPTPRPITLEDRKVITKFVKKVTIYKKKVVVLRRKLVILRRRYVSAPVDKKPFIRKQIVIVEKTITKHIEKIVSIKRTIHRIKHVCVVRPTTRPVVIGGVVLPVPRPRPRPIPTWVAKETSEFVKTCNGKRVAYEKCETEWKQIKDKCEAGSLEEGVLEGCIKKQKECDGSRKASKKCFHTIGQITRPVKPWEPITIPDGVIIKPLTPVAIKIVKVFEKKIEIFKKKVEVIRSKIVVLVKQRETAPDTEKPSITKKIVVLRKIVTKIVRKIKFCQSTIVRVKLPVRLPGEPHIIRPVITPQVIQIVKEFKSTVTTLKTKEVVIIKKIKELEIKLPTLPESEKAVTIRKIVVYKKLVKRIQVKIVNIERTIERITKPTPGPIVRPRPIKPWQRVIVTKYVKKVSILEKKVISITKKIDELVIKIPTLPVDQRPIYRRRIVVLRRSIVKINKTIVSINKKIEKITTVTIGKIIKAPKDFVVVANGIGKICRKQKKTAVETCAKAKKCESEEGVTTGEITLKGAECTAEWQPKCDDAKKRVKKCLRIVRTIRKPWTPRPGDDLVIPGIPNIRPFPVTPEITKVVNIFKSKKTVLEKKIVKITKSIKILESKPQTPVVVS